MNTSEGTGSERRKYVRYHLNATADLIFKNGSTSHGELDNISTGGMYVNVSGDLPKKLLDAPVNATIKATTSRGDVTVETECTVVRADKLGIAFYFDSMNLTHRERLRNLIIELNNLVRSGR